MLHVLSAEVLVAWLGVGLFAFAGGVAWVHETRKRMRRWSPASDDAAVHAFPQRAASAVAADVVAPLKDQLAG